MAIACRYCNLVLTISDPAHVDAARRAIVREASTLVDDETLIGRLTVVIQELARNLVNHAGGGELLFSHDGRRISLIAMDNGPGMDNIAQCLADHYSTTGTMGAGLGAIRRMSDEFDLYSRPGQGALVYAGFRLPCGPRDPEPRVGTVCTAYPGEDVCGDSWAVKGHRVMVCDGLGHGHLAHEASRKAREVFLLHNPSLPLTAVMEQLHRALLPTRGGAVALAEIEPAIGRVSFCGIGNISGMLAGDRSRGLMSSNGTVGYKIGRIQSFSYPWDKAMPLILTSDGITTRYNLSGDLAILGRHPALIAALIHRDYKRLNDDVTVVVMKGE
ncbi:SpoIIE family protein phosphatase [Stutzerimonas tarimensis]|uniref:SpoIIE family protein phosphatase n=1 Tax=Stutzerimonas tarimensis TaxID=1507735 RepID=A0ABV7T2L0_9GAMM